MIHSRASPRAAPQIHPPRARIRDWATERNYIEPRFMVNSLGKLEFYSILLALSCHCIVRGKSGILKGGGSRFITAQQGAVLCYSQKQHSETMGFICCFDYSSARLSIRVCRTCAPGPEMLAITIKQLYPELNCYPALEPS